MLGERVGTPLDKARPGEHRNTRATSATSPSLRAAPPTGAYAYRMSRSSKFVGLSTTIQHSLYSSGVAVTTGLDMATLGRIGTALADPTRRWILVSLIDGPGYPAELADEFGTTRANLSNHLACLRECGLVLATAEGRRVRYDLADPRLAEALGLLASLDLPGRCD